MKSTVYTLLFFISPVMAIAQTQSVRGIVRDKESQTPLEGVSISITTHGPDSGRSTRTLAGGEFGFENVQVGRIDLQVSRTEYQNQILNNIIVSSGKEVVLIIEMEEEIVTIAEATVKVKLRQGQPNNENALVSSRLFTVDETDRFAGSRGDPARMASNFAGVQGADDSRNDIVVRGNSPQGVLWRLEGIDIPNPNHFAIPGTTGGPVSIINNKILANSDFFTGAFPAEYGNSTAGAFDLRMRNGNNRQTEFSSQFGFLGWDLMAEGPLKKGGKSSFLATYRYSTLALFDKMNIQIGTDAIPQYQDASFKLNFPIGSRSNLAVFGIGGLSNINIKISDQKESSSELYGDEDRDQRFGSRMGVVGANYTFNINSRSYFRAILAVSHQSQSAEHELVFRSIVDSFVRDEKKVYRFQLDSMFPNLRYRFAINTVGTHLFINQKINSGLTIKYGLQLTRYGFNFHDSGINFDTADKANYRNWFVRWNSNGSGLMVQPYFQLRWKPTMKWQFSAGIASQVFAVADDRSGIRNTSADAIQPRLGIRYSITNRQFINLGAGFHSQMQPAYTYYYILPGNQNPHNMNMGLTKSRHLVLGYETNIGRDKRFRFETYYQSLSNIPVEIRQSSFSLANTGSGFSRFFPDSLANHGTGRNYGVEFTMEKSFTKGYYYLATFSLFDAKYTGSDGVERNSDFNTNYAFNALIAKEWKVGRRGILNAGGKVTMAGARRYSPIDLEASKKAREYVELDSAKNTLRFGKAYSRFDIRVSYKINAKKVTHEFAIDLINVSNNKNILKYTYTNEAPYFREEYQLGFLPIFYYKIDF